MQRTSILVCHSHLTNAAKLTRSPENMFPYRQGYVHIDTLLGNAVSLEYSSYWANEPYLLSFHAVFRIECVMIAASKLDIDNLPFDKQRLVIATCYWYTFLYFPSCLYKGKVVSFDS